MFNVFSEPAPVEELIGFFSSVDLVETGDTMRAAGLEVVADILTTEVRLFKDLQGDHQQ